MVLNLISASEIFYAVKTYRNSKKEEQSRWNIFYNFSTNEVIFQNKSGAKAHGLVRLSSINASRLSNGKVIDSYSLRQNLNLYLPELDSGFSISNINRRYNRVPLNIILLVHGVRSHYKTLDRFISKRNSDYKVPRNITYEISLTFKDGDSNQQSILISRF